jgi:hypothetical protein
MAGTRRLILALAALTAVAALLTPVAPASAGLLDVTCTPPSSDLATYSPPLTSTPQTVTATVTTQYGPCVSVSQPAVTSGSRTITLTGTRDCLELLNVTSAILTITWNTGQTSTITGNRVGNVVGAVIVFTITGTVTSGLFAGDTVVQTITGPATDILLCTAGLSTVSSVYSLVTLEITSV